MVSNGALVTFDWPAGEHDCSGESKLAGKVAQGRTPVGLHEPTGVA
jgi:hypothetical protein